MVAGALGSLCEGGEEEQGGSSEGLLEASHAGKGAGTGKKRVKKGEAKVGWSLSRTASRRLER